MVIHTAASSGESGRSDLVHRELMEGQREYLKRKEELESSAAESTRAKSASDAVRMKEKVTKLIKKRRLAKMALVLDTSTVRLKYNTPTHHIPNTCDTRCHHMFPWPQLVSVSRLRRIKDGCACVILHGLLKASCITRNAFLCLYRVRMSYANRMTLDEVGCL